MKNEIEVINGVRGEWRTVTKPEEVMVGQRVRYTGNYTCYGSTSAENESDRVRIYRKQWNKILFNYSWKKVEAFFPLPSKLAKQKRKVAKIIIENIHCCNDFHQWICDIGFDKAKMYSTSYANRKSAIRGARRFCKAIGYECEIIKGDML